MLKFFFKKIGNQHAAYEKLYRKMAAESDKALNLSKRAIFAFHRSDLKNGELFLKEASGLLNNLESDFKKEPMLRFEGAHRAALEEFIEANLFFQFLLDRPPGKIFGFEKVDTELYLGGLSDFTGEIVRYAVSSATNGKIEEVKRAKKVIDEVMEFLIGLDLTGHLRTKYDQAKNSFRRIEEIMYDISLKIQN